MSKIKNPSEYSKVISSAPIGGLSSTPSKRIKTMKKKKSIFSEKS